MNKQFGVNKLALDKSQVAQRFAQATQSYSAHAQIQAKMSQHLVALMTHFLAAKNDWRCLEIGCGTGHLSRYLIEQLKTEQLILNDIYPEVRQHFSDAAVFEWLIGDIESVTWPASLNLIATSSVLQWMTDLDGVLAKASAALENEGYLCFSSFGPDNLLEIKTLTGRGLDYWSLAQWSAGLERHDFEILHLSEQLHSLHFPNPQQVLKHLKATGVTATAQTYRWTKQSLQQFYQDYQHQFSSLNPQTGERQYRLRYHPIFGIARRK